MPDNGRPGWQQVWLDVAFTMATRSRCVRAQVGCVLVSRDNRVISSSYNGPPPGMMVAGNCQGWCPRATASSLEPGYTDCVANHAEANAIARADFTQLQRGTAYVTGSVCYTCAKMLAASGVGLVVMIVRDNESHRTPERTIRLFDQSGLKYVVVTEKDLYGT